MVFVIHSRVLEFITSSFLALLCVLSPFLSFLSLKSFFFVPWALLVECPHAPSHPLLVQWRRLHQPGQRWLSNSVLHLVGLLGLLLGHSPRRGGEADDLLHFQLGWRWPLPLGTTAGLPCKECAVLEAKQSHTDGHGWNCLPKKFLAFPFPLTASGKNLYLWLGFHMRLFWGRGLEQEICHVVT